MNFQQEIDLLLQHMRRKTMTCEQCQRHIDRYVDDLKIGRRKAKRYKKMEVSMLRNLFRYANEFCLARVDTDDAAKELERRDERLRKLRLAKLVIGGVRVD